MRIAMVSLLHDHDMSDRAEWLCPRGGQDFAAASLLARRDHEVDLYVSADGARRARAEELSEGVRLVAVEEPGNWAVPSRSAQLSGAGSRLDEQWRVRPPDVVHAREEFAGLAVAACRRRDVPRVQSFRRGVCLAPTLLEQASAVQARSREEMDELNRLGLPRTKGRVIPAGIDLERFCPDGGVAGHGELQRVVAIVDPDDFAPVEGLLSTLRRRSGVELVICTAPGADAARSRLEHAIGRYVRHFGLDDRVVLLGPVASERLAPILRSADLVVCGMRDEPAERATLAAMACGRPVIATDRGGASDTVIDGTTGLLVRPGDRPALECATEALLDDPLLRECGGEAGLDRAVRRYGPEQIGREIEDFYRQVVTA